VLVEEGLQTLKAIWRREQSPRARLKTTALVKQKEKIGVIHRKSEDHKCLLSGRASQSNPPQGYRHRKVVKK